jgi:RimJ/RimL family protein N-acetyltransferase
LRNFVARGDRSGFNASTMTDLITSRLILHPLTIEEARRVVGGIPSPADTWADGFPGEGDRDAARMALKATGGTEDGEWFRGTDLDDGAYAYAAYADAEADVPADADANARADDDAFTCYRIDCRRDSAAIGTIGFHGPPDARRQVTIGYGLVPHSWGNGYATEAVRALIELCRTHPAVRSVAADTGHGNHASQRVLTKAGFRLVRQDHDLLYYELALS